VEIVSSARSMHIGYKEDKWATQSGIRPFKWLGCRCSGSYYKYGKICYAEPGLTEALYILYIYFTQTQKKCKHLLHYDKWLTTADNDSDKRETRPLVREGVPQKQDRIWQTVINIWSWAPDWSRHQDLLIDWPSVVMWFWLWLWLWIWPSQIPCGGGF
jgi:hypothetical protein